MNSFEVYDSAKKGSAKERILVLCMHGSISEYSSSPNPRIDTDCMHHQSTMIDTDSSIFQDTTMGASMVLVNLLHVDIQFVFKTYVAIAETCPH